MTLDEDFETVTFWDVIRHKQVDLPGRIDNPKLLKQYIMPEKYIRDNEKKFKAA